MKNQKNIAGMQFKKIKKLSIFLKISMSKKWIF